MTKILIRGGVVLSMDQAIGILPQGDLLIGSDKILAVGRQLDQPEATVVDASGKIVMPGLINAHIHTWQTAIRNWGNVPIIWT